MTSTYFADAVFDAPGQLTIFNKQSLPLSEEINAEES